jgi:para-aminobenzoate N-oxygenase AurF
VAPVEPYSGRLFRLARKTDTASKGPLSNRDDLPRVERWSLDYHSRFEQWEDKAVVKQTHRIEPFDDKLLFFSPDVSPLFVHPEVRAAPDDVKRALLVLNLFDWLEFTVRLEMGPVNDSCNLLSWAHFLPWLPAEMRADALKIYTDEAGHAEMSHALARATERATGVTSLQLRPAFLDAFDAILVEHDRYLDPLLTLCFTVVSETLITGSLKKLPRDDRVQSAVRAFARHHAEDEARHHHFFRELCEMLWPRLPYEVRVTVGPLLPEMILTFLAPEYEPTARMLHQFPETFEHPQRIAAEIVRSPEVVAGVRDSCLPTLRMFDKCGVFSDEEVLDAFVELDLSPPASILERLASD